MSTALDQISDTVKAVCNRSSAVRNAHTAPVIDAVRSLHKQGHGKGLSG